MPVANKLDQIAIDILGELPETDNGNKYIIVVSDYYTKWTHAMAVPNQLAQTVADELMIHIRFRNAKTITYQPRSQF